jgi:tetratricopeptide (TPR) repeat protein
VLLHGLVAILAWGCCRRVGTHDGTALLAGVLFAVHPIHAEAVANVAGRAELLAAAFVLAAWIAHARARNGGDATVRWCWAATAGLAWLAAVLSKESAVLAPVVFGVDDLLRKRSGERMAPLPIWFVYAAATAVYLALRYNALGGFGSPGDAIFLDNPVLDASAPVRVATAIWVQIRGLALMVWPMALSSDYSFDSIAVVRSWTDPRLLAGIGLVTAAVWGTVAGVRRSHPVAVAIIVWVAFALPSSNVLFPSGVLMAERLWYLPSLGACLLVAHMGAMIAGTGRRRMYAVVSLAVAVTVVLGARSAVRSPDWRDNATLTLTDVGTNPESAKLQAGAAFALHGRGELAAAETHYRRALAIWPQYAQVHYNFGALLRNTGRTDEAIEHWRDAARLSPGNPRPLDALAGLVRDPQTSPAQRAAASRALREFSPPARR